MEQTELNKILEQHQLFLDGKGGKRADLEGANLYRANLKDANLTGANLTGANLICAILEGAILGGAILKGAILKGANLGGAILTGANLTGADLICADLRGANLEYANLQCADLTGAIGLPNVSWVIPGCLVQLNENMRSFYLEKENKLVNFVQDSFGFIIQNNPEEGTFDILAEDRIIRNIPHWVKLSGLKQVLS